MSQPFESPDKLLEPREVASYLAASGWELEQQRGTASEVWRLPSSTDRTTRLLLPRDPDYADFRARMEDALRLLRAVNEFTPEQLQIRILQTRADVFYVRADQSTTDGTIPLKQAEDLVVGARKLCWAAASSTVKPRVKILGRQSKEVSDFLNEDLRMAHTQRGSFVITVLTRLDDPEVTTVEPEDLPQGGPGARHEDLIEVVLPSFQRRVMTTLSRGLTSAARSASTADLDGLLDGVDRGAGADLYAALDSMTGYSGLRTLDLSFDWAPAEPQTFDVDQEIVFTRDEIPQLKSAKEQLTRAPDIEHDSITGQVVRLERGEEQDEGVITITGVVGRGTKRNVRLMLHGKEYAAAVTAHRRRQPVTCVGDLEKKGREYWMRSPSFEVVTSLAAQRAED